jgi:flagellar basal-body rod protein FlgG
MTTIAEVFTLIRGLYTAATGAIVAQSNVDVIANNLANVNTSGFKRTLMQVESAPKSQLFRDQIDPGQTPGNRTRGVAAHVAVGDLGFGSRIYDTPAVFDQGAIQQTDNPLDLALSGPGFMAVKDANGATSYVRGGALVKNPQGELVTGDGDRVLGTNGQPIALQPQGSVQIDRTGSVISDGQPAGQLAVFEFANLTAVRPQGASKFVNTGAAPKPAVNTTVLQGAQEKSNADVVTSMVGLISNERWFDANEKMITTQDTELGIAISTVGKTAQ